MRAQMAALSRGSYIELPRSQWLGKELSEALGERTDAVLRHYRRALTALRASFGERHREGCEPIHAPSRDAHAARRFDFTDKRGARGSNDAALVLGAMRAPFLLLLLADDLSRSFLPLFAAGLPVGPLPMSPTLVASLPIAAFMLVVALSQPVLGGWSERIGRRRSLLAAAALACVAHLLSAQAGTLLELAGLARGGGAAWAIAFVAAQGYVLDHTDAHTRTAGLAAFVGIIMVSMICGPSIGGILADGIGYRGDAGARWRLTFASLGWRGAGCRAIARPQRPRRERRPPPPPLRGGRGWPRVSRIAASCCCCCSPRSPRS